MATFIEFLKANYMEDTKLMTWLGDHLFGKPNQTVSGIGGGPIFRVNVAVRATDLDTKDVKIESDRVTDKSYAASFILNLKNRNWMKGAGFANFLNEMGQTRAKYGGVLA